MTISFKMSDLSGFTGTTSYARYPMGGLLCTDGVQYIMARGCGWLVDVIASAQTLPWVRDMPFQHWVLTVADDQTCIVACDDGDGHAPAWSQTISYTDFPTGEPMRLYLVDHVLMLPSEY